METPFHKPVVCPVLIDRVDELATLYTLIDQAKSGRGQVVLLGGEAGIGKSRLVAETKAYAAAQDFLLLQGNCFQANISSPYAPLIDLLRFSAATQLTATIASDLAPFRREWHQLLPDVVPLPTNLVSLSSPDPEQEKHRLFTALAQFFTGQATKQPVLLIMEDIHWSDETSLEFLYYLARRCTAQPLLIFLTYRSEEVRPGLRHFLAQLDRERVAQELSLNRLTHSEVVAMLRAIVTLSPTLHLELPELIYVLTEGNPFFVEEILKSLTATGDIFYVDGRWECKPLVEWHIPRSVQDAVQQRTDSLSEPARHVLILAAVVGRRFDFALLQQLMQHDGFQLLSLMKELIAAQLVVEESEERFAFRHALTRQAVYADLLVRERKAMHRTVADTMERLYSAVLETHQADLAYHFYEAGAWEKALGYGQRAGEQAQDMYAPRAATEQFTRALDAAQRGAIPPPTTLYRLRGQAYEMLGEFEQARLDYEATLQMAKEAGERHVEWQAVTDLGFLWAARDYAQTGTYYQQALELARQMDDPLTLAHSLNRLGNWYVNIGQSLEGLRYHQKALAIFQGVNDQHGLAETLDLLGMASLLSGDMVQGVAYYQQAAALFQQLDDRQGLVSSLMQLMLACGSDMTGPAILSLSESLHYGHWELGVLYLDLFDLPTAQQHLEQALVLAHQIGSEYWICMASGLLALVSIARQDVTRAESILSAAPGSGAPTQTAGQLIVWYAHAELPLGGSAFPASRKCAVKRWPHSNGEQKLKLRCVLRKKMHMPKGCDHCCGVFSLPRASSIKSKGAEKKLSRRSRLPGCSSRNLLPAYQASTYVSISSFKPLLCFLSSVRSHQAVLPGRPLEGSQRANARLRRSLHKENPIARSPICWSSALGPSKPM